MTIYESPFKTTEQSLPTNLVVDQMLSFMHSNIYNKNADDSMGKFVVVRCEPQSEEEGKIL
jgi:hypothetical protein